MNANLSKLEEITGILNTFDMVDSKRIEREVYLLLNAVTDMVIITDTEGKIRFANPSTYRLVGYDPDLLHGTYIGDIAPIKDIRNNANKSIDMILTSKEGGQVRTNAYIGMFEDTDLHLFVLIFRKSA